MVLHRSTLDSPWQRVKSFLKNVYGYDLHLRTMNVFIWNKLCSYSRIKSYLWIFCCSLHQCFKKGYRVLLYSLCDDISSLRINVLYSPFAHFIISANVKNPANIRTVHFIILNKQKYMFVRRITLTCYVRANMYDS